MQLNLVNKSVIVESTGIGEEVCPRLGEYLLAGGKAFKFSPQGRREEAVLIERVDLSSLFAGIPQDISGFTEGQPAAVDVAQVCSSIDFPVERLEAPVTADDQLFADKSDPTLYWFGIWCEWVGLRDLSPAEVTLGIVNGQLLIDASRSLLYSGTITVKIGVA